MSRLLPLRGCARPSLSLSLSLSRLFFLKCRGHSLSSCGCYAGDLGAAYADANCMLHCSGYCLSCWLCCPLGIHACLGCKHRMAVRKANGITGTAVSGGMAKLRHVFLPRPLALCPSHHLASLRCGTSSATGAAAAARSSKKSANSTRTGEKHQTNKIGRENSISSSLFGLCVF
jgi:hypothetical protein